MRVRGLLTVLLVGLWLTCLTGAGTAQGLLQGLLPPVQDTPIIEPEEEDAELPALLVADSIVVGPENQLIAEGNVEVLYDGRTLRASRVIYDQETDRVTLQGPLRAESDAGTIILASEAEVDADLRDGLLRGARLVLDRQLQLAAVQLARVEGRYSVLSRASVTSCRICTDGNPPLWEIRARRIIHDDVEQLLYLDGAQVRVLDVPLAYVPHLRLPDPRRERARGFLFPSVRTTTKLGLGVKLPYFQPIGPHKDITLTPYVSPETRTMEFRYRQAARAGDFELNGAITRDTLRTDETRGYLFAEGAFDVGQNFDLSFDLELTSDEAYMRDYGYSDKSRLDSAANLTRVERDQFTRAEIIHYRTLRDDEDDATQPAIILDAVHHQRLHPSFGGETRVFAGVHGHYRFSDDDVVGRDVYRATSSALWRNSWLLNEGAELTFRGGVGVDAVRNEQDTTSATNDVSVAPFAAATLRYPLVATNASGARFSLEPLVQASWVGGNQLETANDESTRSEFDEGNLLALSRFSAGDRRERGSAFAMGARWAVIDPSGWRTGLSVGRIFRSETRDDFSPSSGLSDKNSDWLLAAELGNTTGLDFIGRALVDSDTGNVNRGEARSTWTNDRLDLAATYLLLPEDAEEARSGRVSEWSFDGGYQVSRHWRASASWHYDLAQDRSSSGTFGLEYQNECVVVRFEADRDFADSDNLDPTTSFELTMELKGFATGGDAGGYLRTCSN